MTRWVNGILLAWAILEIVRVRRRRSGTVRDRGSWWAVGASVALAFVLADGLMAWAARTEVPPWSREVAMLGLSLMIAGIALRQWAIRTLGPWFSPRVTIQATQTLVTHGPYRVLRHPAYTGAWLALMGAGVATRHFWSAAVLTTMPLLGLLYRIRVEEAALTAHFGEAYRRYAQKTWRLIPWVY